MLSIKRLSEIENRLAGKAQRIVLLEMDGEFLQLIAYLNDGTNLRITELWNGNELKKYSYYWLTASNALKIGWDNAPHHTQVKTHPHHKHVNYQENIQPSLQTNLQEIVNIITK